MPRHSQSAVKAFTASSEVFAWCESFTNLEARAHQYTTRTYRLDRMRYLLGLFGNPQQAYGILHVAGSKGKGSTAALLAGALTAAGFVTGLYASPHVSSCLERITVSMRGPDERLLTELGNRIREGVGKTSLQAVSEYSEPTTFELLTLLALLYFKASGCRYVVLEVGLGGRLDATNVVTPLAAVITPLELEHTEILGSSLQQIAAEKAGIIKQGIPVFCGLQPPGAEEVIRQQAAFRQAPLVLAAEAAVISGLKLTTKGTRFKLAACGRRAVTVKLRLLGRFQAENAALAWLTLRAVLPRLPARLILKGFRQTSLPGRMELIRGAAPFVFDGAHTPFSTQAVCSLFRQLFPGDAILIFGSVKGKDHRQMAAVLAPFFRYVIVSTPGTFKESDIREVYAAFRDLNGHTLLEAAPGDACRTALELAGGKMTILVTGSFYMVAEIRRLVV